MNWTKGIIKQNSTMLDRLYRTLKDLEHIDAYTNNHALPQNILEGFYDDLNTPKVIAELNILTNKVTIADEEEKGLIKILLVRNGKSSGYSSTRS